MRIAFVQLTFSCQNIFSRIARVMQLKSKSDRNKKQKYSELIVGSVAMNNKEANGGISALFASGLICLPVHVSLNILSTPTLDYASI